MLTQYSFTETCQSARKLFPRCVGIAQCHASAYLHSWNRKWPSVALFL